MDELKLEKLSDNPNFQMSLEAKIGADYQYGNDEQVVVELQAQHKQLLVNAVSEERDRIHVEINKMLKPLKLHLALLTGGETPSEDYGLADEDGDWVDFISIFEPALGE